MSKRISNQVYADVHHSCGHVVRYEFRKPKTAKEHDAHSVELKRKAIEPCYPCQELQELDTAMWKTMPLLKALSQIDDVLGALSCKWKRPRTQEEEVILRKLLDARETVRREHEARRQGGAR